MAAGAFCAATRFDIRRKGMKFLKRL